VEVCIPGKSIGGDTATRSGTNSARIQVRIETRSERSALMHDYENFHVGGTNGSKNVLFGDGHVAKL
jgi:prepilin-type processing-associated H-X9-DG protein